MGARSYKDLEVWQESMKLVLGVYRLLELFPQKEQFAPCGQLRRAVVSIPSNIAEGFCRDTHKDSISRMLGSLIRKLQRPAPSTRHQALGTN